MFVTTCLIDLMPRNNTLRYLRSGILSDLSEITQLYGLHNHQISFEKFITSNNMEIRRIVRDYTVPYPQFYYIK